MEHGVPQGSVLGPLLFLIYINDLAGILRDVAKPILFTDDTSIIIENVNLDEFKIGLQSAVNETMKWFQSNLLSINYKKTHLLQFLTKQYKKLNVQIVALYSIIANVNSTKFLGLIINLLKPTGHVMHQQFNIQQLYVLPTLYLCVSYLSENKQRLVPLTA